MKFELISPGGPNNTYGSLSTLEMMFLTADCCSLFNLLKAIPAYL